MNRIRSILYTSVRTYARGTRGKRGNAVAEKVWDPNVEKEELLEDMDAYESDFMNVDKAYDADEKEQYIGKQKLKNYIVAQKYFKEDPDPKFLTFIEKDEIKRLHRMDPEEWTAERLSESFPALPKTIKKVLESQWIPKSVNEVMKYDATVIQNWKKFNAGKLAVSAALKEHLMKFKGRKISVENREALAETLVRPPPVFPKPNSKLFSSIVAGHAEEQPSGLEQKQLLPGNNIRQNKNKYINSIDQNKSVNKMSMTFHQSKIENQKTETINNHDDSVFNTSNNEHTEKLREENPNSLAKRAQSYEKGQDIHKKHELITFNEFAKSKLKELYETAPEEGITLISEYKKYLEKYEQGNTENEKLSAKSNAATELQTSRCNPKNKVTGLNANDMNRNDSSNKSQIHLGNEEELKDLDVVNTSNSAVSTELKTNEKDIEIDEHTETKLDTCIKEWNIKIEEGEYFENYIKIPRKLYKEGMLYRIKDCYYDDDGEFLYRVPGLRN